MVKSKASSRVVTMAAALTSLAATLTAGVGIAGANAAGDPNPGASLAAERAALVAATDGAKAFVKSDPAALHGSAKDAYTRVGKQIGAGDRVYVSYSREFKGLPVYGGDFVVVTDRAGNVVGTSVAQDREVKGVSTEAGITADAAQQAAQSVVDGFDSASTPTLVVHALGKPRLAWQTEVSGVKGNFPSRQTVYVDANSGEVINSIEHIITGEGEGNYNGPSPLQLDTSAANGGFALTNSANSEITCQNASGRTFTGPDDAWGNGDGTDLETACVDGFYAQQMLNNMLGEWLERDGMGGDGSWVPLRVGLDDLNAYYDGSKVFIGHNQDDEWITSIDVVAHEFGHGIDDHTPGGISGGGTQEFIADVFGAATEHFSNQSADFDDPDFLVGEEIDLVGSGPIRNMYDPSQVGGDPNCWSTSIPRGEVHATAGPGNHWFYLLSQGNAPADGPESPICAGGPDSVSGIGIQKAAKILYNAMLMKTSDSDYLKYRTWTLESAKALYPETCTEFNAVKDAWDAVSVPAQADDPTCEGGEEPPTEPPTEPPAGDEVSFDGIAALNNCSASVVRFENSQPGDNAIGMTNGHCYEGGFPEAGEVLTNLPSSRNFTLLDADGNDLANVRASKLLYSTMTGTDLSLYELNTTYADLEAEGFTARTLAQAGPEAGSDIAVVSGYWNRIYNCSAGDTIHQLKEDQWTFEQSIKYTQPGCETIPGTSGSPILDATTGQVVGINNTGNEDGEECTMNNPCEVDADGNVTVEQGAAYGQQTAWVYSCLAEDNSLDLSVQGCELPAPSTVSGNGNGKGKGRH